MVDLTDAPIYSTRSSLSLIASASIPLEDLRYLIIKKIQIDAKKRESKKIMYLSKGELLRVNPAKYEHRH